MRCSRSVYFLVSSLLIAVGAVPAQAQDLVPVISGAAGFIYTKDAGQTSLQPILSPVVLIPLGPKLLVESNVEMQGFVARSSPGGPYEGQYFFSVGYLQLDYVVNSHLTIVAGRFLPPFNIFSERVGPLWIQNFQDGPIIYPIGTRTSGLSDGGMIRGVIASRPGWLLNYAAFFSARSNSSAFSAGRAAGARAGLFLPKANFEFGASFERFLQDHHYNSYGGYFVWQPATHVDVKAEYAHSPQGHGYWIEGAYRFRESDPWGRALKNIQPVVRGQQFYRLAPGVNDFLPQADTQRVDFGLNYYLPHEVRVNGSYGRQFSSTGNSNNWTLDITYRFLFPVPFWPKGAQ